MIGTGIFIGACIAGAGLLLLGKKGIRRATGYMIASDATMSAYGVSMGAGSGTAVGVASGFIGALFLSLGLRGAARFTGSERLAVNNDTRVRVVAAAALSQGSHWIRASVTSLWRGTDVVAPVEYNWAWQEVKAPATLGQMTKSLRSRFQEWRYA